MSNHSKIAIINPGAGLGDHIMTLPALQAIRASIPDAQIDIISSGRTRNTTAILPEINRFLPLPEGNSVKLFFTLFSILRKEKYNAALYLGKSPFIGFLLKIANIDNSIGYRFSSYSQLFLLKWRPFDKDTYVGEQHLALSNTLINTLNFPIKTNISSIPNLDLKILKNYENQTLVPSVANNSKIKIMIHPGFSQASERRRYLKAWPMKSWGCLIDALANQYPDACIYLLGGPDDTEVLAYLSEFTKTLAPSKQSRIINLFKKTKNIEDLAYILSKSTLLISVDSFPMHLGVSLQKSVLAIFASTNEKNYLPTLPSVSSVSRQDLACRPCLWVTRKHSCKTPVCLQVPVSVVLQRAIQMIGPTD